MGCNYSKNKVLPYINNYIEPISEEKRLKDQLDSDMSKFLQLSIFLNDLELGKFDNNNLNKENDIQTIKKEHKRLIEIIHLRLELYKSITGNYYDNNLF